MKKIKLFVFRLVAFASLLGVLSAMGSSELGCISCLKALGVSLLCIGLFLVSATAEAITKSKKY